MTRYTEWPAEHPSVLAALIVIRRLACNGRPPSMRIYNEQRGSALSSGAMAGHGWDWAALVKAAGMTVRQQGNKKGQKLNIRHEVPVALEAEIQAAFERGDNLPLSRQEWPLRAIPTRVEVRDIPLPDGSVYRVTSYYASIR